MTGTSHKGEAGAFWRVLLFCVCCAVVLMAASALTKNIAGPSGDIILGVVAALATFGLTAAFCRWERIPLRAIGVLPAPKTLPKFGWGVCIGLSLAAAQVSLVLATAPCRLEAAAPHLSEVVLTLSLYTVLALREELAFRGFALQVLFKKFGMWPAQLAIALVFALEHWAGGYTWTQAFLGAGTGALLFGIAAITTKGIAMPVGIHLAWNFGQWCVGFKGASGLWRCAVETGADARFQTASLAWYMVVMLVAVCIFWLYRRKTLNRPEI